MFTSVLMLALTVHANTQGADPTWAQDYGQALKRGAEEKKPVAVFLGTGNRGYTQVVNDGNLSQEVSDILSIQYICVYIDTNTPQGRQMSQAFGIPTGRGIVLSDRSGVYQTFNRAGAMSNQEIVRQLQTNSSRTSYYPPETSQAPAGGVAPSASYCPSCQGGGRRR